MAPLDESWFGEGERVRKESISVRISAKAQEVLKMAGELESDGEEDYSGCCLMRGRSMSRRLSASGSDVKGGPFTRLSAEDPESAKAKRKYVRSRSVCATIFFCCGPREQRQYTTVEVRAVKQDRTWEVDVKEDYSKPPYWKQVVRKVRSQCRPRQKPEWLNNDAHSYQMNFDDGCWRETCSAASFLYADESDDSATRARAMHAALFKSRVAHQDAPGSPVLSPLPVKMVSKERDIERSKDGFVPIWQRRQGAPPIKLDLRQRSGPMED